MTLSHGLSGLIRAAALLFLMFASLLLPVQTSFGRGGSLRWGYIPPAGGPLNTWVFASPWASLYGWGIPHHSLEGPGYGSGNFPGWLSLSIL